MTPVDLWLPLRGRSMWPLGPPVEAGVVRTPWEELQRGDLVAFVGPAPGQVWLHRVQAIAPSSVQTRGDTCLLPDAPVPREALLGRVVAWRIVGVRLPVAVRGPLAHLRRRVGLGWADIAPHLRHAWSALPKC